MDDLHILEYQHNRTYDNFVAVVDQLSWFDKWRLGERYTYWKIAAIYTFVVDGIIDIDPCKIISQYLEICAIARNNPSKKYLLPYLYAATGYADFAETPCNDIIII